MDCRSCGAALPAKSNICQFCGTLNDTDLRALDHRRGPGAQAEEDCPRCEVPMAALDLGGEGGLTIDRCPECLGIFFDPGELEALIGASVSTVAEVDYERLTRFVEEEAYNLDVPVRYVKCPRCGKLMNRKAYGARSGVVVDTCKEHGVWLDGGELGQLLKWAKVGGRAHDAKQKENQKRRESRRRLESLKPQPKDWHTSSDPVLYDDLLGGVVRFLIRLLD